MEAIDSNVTTLMNYLQQTLSGDNSVRRPAEKYLMSIEGNRNYPILLLHLIDKQDYDLIVRIAASITFKNFIKRNWIIDEDGNNKISEEDRNTIKNLIIGLMLKSEEQIQRQLSDAVSIIGKEDFPVKWPNLLNEMIARMESSGGDFRIINGILQTCHSLFKRYRHEFKSQQLWSEIKFVLDLFAKPFTDLFVATVALSQTHANNPQALKVIFSSLVLCTKIFNSLNAQDLPEFFEDNMSTWMQHFLNLLSVDNNLLKTDDDEEAGLLEQLKSQICDNIAMYAQKYHDEFSTYLPGFVEAVWNLLINTGPEPKYDILVSNAIHFLSTVADRPQYENLFQAEGVLDSLCSKVIIPNMQFRQSDEEMFEDNPEEYIRRDIEGSDVDTRRRAACDLVKSLRRYFEAQITRVFSQYIDSMLASFAANPREHWKSKDAAIYLVTAMSVKGSTTRYGTTQTSELVNIVDFYQNYVKPDLVRSANLDEFPVLRADALKYLMTFRNQLSLTDVIIPSVPIIIQHFNAPSVVVHTYAAYTIERYFTMKDVAHNNAPLIKIEHIQSYVTPLVQGLFGVLLLPGSTENEYVMKAIMRTISLLQENILPFLQDIMSKLTSKLREISRNPSKPFFNHYLFESLSLCIRIACRNNKQAVEVFEALLFPFFQEILIQDVQEFMPYVFQVLSLLLEVHEQGISEAYMQLFPCLLTPVLWDRPANIHPLVRLLQAFIEKGAKQIVASGKLSGLLGVFQKLIASKTNDHEGFYLLQSIIEHMDSHDLEPYMKQIFMLLFTRLSNSKTTKFVKCLLVFFSLFAYKYGPLQLVSTIDSIQPKMFGMVVERVYIPEMQKVSGSTERKICAVGATKILSEVPAMIEGEYAAYWAPLLQAVIGLFELPEDDSVPEDEHFIEIEETPGYQASYAQLVFAGKREHDVFNGTINDPRLYLAQCLNQTSAKYPGKLPPVISSGLVPEAAQHLQKYLSAANLAIV
ncbi:exportin-2-like isoform X2 [Dinothrombium tinctorium]|uniref:Exportin-2 n=1 Tax=Dinothrombium tinctorium TaxID=1965070 RepID=A0A3S3PB34_9ACAR|nr:exportin-2-like isoform X2 [Dinothrombium tinctorium]RWS11700.1 exportin-2-like isoform X2 [Dinothrombium tinctorium]RWS12522.1 exportin-2-like isoform X2 [Dinothrombium tinctorium]